MSNYTPGPWVAELGRDGCFSIEADRFGITGGLLVLASRNEHPLLADQMHANARLIAAAPELLEALQNLLNDTQHKEHQDCDDGPCPVREARAAIAKATGGAL